MATKKTIELKNIADADLLSEVSLAEAQLEKLRLEHAVTGLQNPNVIRSTRKDIARLKTEISNRKFAAMGDEQLAMRSKIRARRRKK